MTFCDVFSLPCCCSRRWLQKLIASLTPLSGLPLHSYHCSATTMSSVEPSQQNESSNVKKAIKAKAEEQRASWTTADETALIQFLIEHSAEAGNGFNFKTKTFSAASLVLNAMRTKGGTKTGKVCKNKWTQVCSVHDKGLPPCSHLLFSNNVFSSKECIQLFQTSRDSLGSSGTRNMVQTSTTTPSQYGKHIYQYIVISAAVHCLQY